MKTCSKFHVKMLRIFLEIRDRMFKSAGPRPTPRPRTNISVCFSTSSATFWRVKAIYGKIARYLCVDSSLSLLGKLVIFS